MERPFWALLLHISPKSSFIRRSRNHRQVADVFAVANPLRDQTGINVPFKEELSNTFDHFWERANLD